MNISALIYRNILFPIIFYVKQLDIFSKMNALKQMDDCLFNDISNIQQFKFTKLLEIALNDSNYYKIIVGKLAGFKYNIGCLSSFPILTKEIVRVNIKNIKTDCKEYDIRMTAGTTGTPVTVHVDKNALSWQLATRYFLFGWHGIRIGDREARFWGRPLQGYEYFLKDILLNRKRFCFCASSKEELIAEYKLLFKYKPDYFYGYSSLILNAAIVCEENNLEPPKLKAIICTAELLGTQQKKFIKRVFGCPVIVEYGCTESDIIAFECEHEKLHVMSHNILIESGSKTGGLVYTDLNNTAMPLIRYELGDNVDIDNSSKCLCKRNLPVISHLEGRTIGQLLILPDGTTLHVVKFAYLIEDIAKNGFEIVQFKIVYENNKLIFYINIIGDIKLFEKEMCLGINKIIKDIIPYSIKYGFIKSRPNKKYSYFEIRD